MQLLRSQFSYFYEGYPGGSELSPEPLQFQYKDFAVWHNQCLGDPGLREESHQYWKKKLGPELPRLKLPYYYNGSRNDRTGAAYRCVVQPAITQKLRHLVLNHDTTLFMVLFSLYNLLLAFLTGQEEIVLSIINAGRQHISLYNIVGYFVNPVPVKNRVNLEEDFDELLSRVKADVLEAFQHQSYPLELVLDEMKLEHPTVSAAFNMLNMQDISTGVQLDSFESFHLPQTREVKFDIVLFLTEYKNSLEIKWEYQKSLFKPETIETIAEKYLHLMDEITADEHRGDTG